MSQHNAIYFDHLIKIVFILVCNPVLKAQYTLLTKVVHQ